MRIAVLKTGSAPRHLQKTDGDFEHMFERVLGQPGQQWEVFDAQAGELPPLEAGHDAFLITGSSDSVTADEPWILALLEHLRLAHEAQRPQLGICFGHQALARALGGEVVQNPQGRDTGSIPITWSADATSVPALGHAPRPLRILQTHEDIVTKLPPGAVHLAHSARTPHEVFALGDHTLALQGHPELTVENIRYLATRRMELGTMSAEEGQAALDSLEHAPHTGFLKAWLQSFLTSGRVSAPLPEAPDAAALPTSRRRG